MLFGKYLLPAWMSQILAQQGGIGIKQHVCCVNEILRHPNYKSRRLLTYCHISSSCLGWGEVRIATRCGAPQQWQSPDSKYPSSTLLQLLPCTTEQVSLLSWCKKAQSSKANKSRIGSIFFFIILAARWHLFSIHILTHIPLTCFFLYILSLLVEMHVSHPLSCLTTLGKVQITFLYTPSFKSRNK